ncbi:MAG: hypothetical protein WBK67_04195 [Minisyncoccales bacterium]|jgi:hypothetical protein
MKNELLHLSQEEIYQLVQDKKNSTEYAILHIQICGECREKLEREKLKPSKAPI